ncbi:MAG: NotI family restriction endonuclease [Alphaproteobacteria bacterium]|nr:NotI family restriction endonuclease [Alphaproteobacteria bacterium]
MPYNPEHIIGEILGRTAVLGYNPASADFICPYINSRCIKRSTKLGKHNPYPVCSIWKKSDNKQIALEDLICVCPKRFYAVDFLKDVVHHCWPGSHPSNPRIAPEVKMKGFGNVDFVIADVQKDQSIAQFLSVELQSIDITGSVMDAYDALLANRFLDKKPTSGLNWKNVYKRYITQLIAKGYFHHHWKTKIVAVIQEQVYKYIKKEADFMCSKNVKDANVNIIFMTYAFDRDPERLGQYKPILQTIEGTSHSSLQNAVLYKNALNREEFCAQISRSLTRVR